MTRLHENLSSALRALRDNWLRSTLTMLGMVIGVGSVVLLIGIGQGVREDVNHQIETLGTNSIFVVPGKLDRYGQPNPFATLGITTLTDRDVRDLTALPGIVQCVRLMFVGGSIERDSSGDGSASAIVIATESAITGILPSRFEAGRFFRPDEETQRVCVLAHAPKEDAFGAAPALGQSVTIRGVPFRVVGVLEREQESLFSQLSTASVVYVPLAAARAAFHGGQINRILLRTDLASDPDIVLRSIRATLLRDHGGKEDFGILTQKNLLKTVSQLSNIVTSLVACIGSISLVVAGIGIMNIMLVTVTERTREIGIRKTVGARNQDIFAQFLAEAVVIASVGGAAGTLLAWAVCRALAAYSPLKPVVAPGAVALAFIVCFAVGVLFGVAPAMRAARQDPIQALRYE